MGYYYTHDILWKTLYNHYNWKVSHSVVTTAWTAGNDTRERGKYIYKWYATISGCYKPNTNFYFNYYEEDWFPYTDLLNKQIFSLSFSFSHLTFIIKLRAYVESHQVRKFSSGV